MNGPKRRNWARYARWPRGTTDGIGADKTTPQCYGPESAEPLLSPGEREPGASRPWSDGYLVAVAGAATLGAWWPSARLGPLGALSLIGLTIAARTWSRRTAAVAGLVAVMAVASVLSARSWAGLDPPPPRAVEGVLTLRTDPARRGPGVLAIGELGGERFAVSAYGGAGRRLERFLAGERVVVVGRASALPPATRHRWVSRHVRARLHLETIADSAPEAPFFRAANRIRRTLTAGTAGWAATDRALFLGLVIGDDRAQPEAMVAAFRLAGLSHLTAVSGQNVAFVLIAASPLLRRLRPSARYVATLALIGWFATLTRFEPSVIRASGMAALAATAFWRGWHASAVRLLAITVAGFILVDPLLVHSVGWWMSIGATAGLALLARGLADRLPGPRWVAVPLAVTLAAQVGVAPVSLLVFGQVSLLAPVANLLAVPVAGFVMVWGLPAGLVAGLVPPLAPVLGFPSRLATRWVARVAELTATLEPAWPSVVVIVIHVLGAAALAAAARRGGTAAEETTRR